MSPKVWIALLAWIVAASTPAHAEPGCAAAAAWLTAAEQQALAGEFAAAADAARRHYDEASRCDELRIATWAWDGWLAAEAAGARGGTAEALTRVRAALEALAAPVGGTSDAAYAAAVLHAAAAAAQDERDEMQVWLEHARDLASRRALTGAPVRWPLPIDLAEGELWSSVDDYELAEAGYMRALAARDSAAGWRGLGRAQDRRGNRAGACDAYRHARDAAATAAAKGAVATEARGYLLLCER